MSGMHLMPVYYNNLNSRRKKKKKVNPEKYTVAWREYNKFLKSIRCPVYTLDEYINYVQGNVKKPKGGKCYGSTTSSNLVSVGSNPTSLANLKPNL